MSEQNAINKQAEDFLIRKSAGDPFVHFELIGTQDYSIGIDDSDGDRLKITSGIDPSSGTELFTIYPSGSITRNLLASFTSGFNNAGQINSLTCRNPNTTNTQSRAKFEAITPSTGGDCWYAVAVSPTKDYVIGIDNSDGDRFKINENAGNAGPSGGTEVFSINPLTRDIRFNNIYEFPITDGTAGQVLATDGAGNVDWQTNSASGKTIQQVYTTNNTYTTVNTTIPRDDTIPQQTEGTEILSLAITPTSASHVLIIEGQIIAYSGGATPVWALFQDATSNALTAGGMVSESNEATFNFRYRMTAGTISSTTFKVRMGKGTTANVHINGNVSGRLFGGVSISSLMITEIIP